MVCLLPNVELVLLRELQNECQNRGEVECVIILTTNELIKDQMKCLYNN